MPFLDTTNHVKLPIFYNVTHAVGADAPNQPEDVKLVQLLLLIAYNNEPKLKSPGGQMKFDGICGPITKSWILRFQNDIKSANKSVAQDRRVDRVRNNQISGSISHTIYTLLWLNMIARDCAPLLYADVPNQIKMTPTAMVPPPSADYIPGKAPAQGPAVQQTSPGWIGRTQTTPATQSSSPK